MGMMLMMGEDARAEREAREVKDREEKASLKLEREAREERQSKEREIRDEREREFRERDRAYEVQLRIDSSCLHFIFYAFSKP